MATTLPLRRPAKLFGKRFAVALVVLVAFAGLTASPAAALLIRGVVPGGGGLTIAPPDPCQPQPQVISFAPDYPTIPQGSPATLNWNVQVPSGCNYMLYVNGQRVALQGSLQVQPLFDTTYPLTLQWGPTRTNYTTATTTVSVTLPVDPADPTRHLVTIPAQAMLPLFVQALGTPNTTVVVNADLDLSGLNQIPIRDGVILRGWRSVAPGQPYLGGPWLTTTRAADPLFSIQGDHVRITGVRIGGPSLPVSTRAIKSESKLNIEIDHNEICGWSYVGVDLADPQGRISVPIQSSSESTGITYALGAEPLWIHDNYFHDNFYGDSGGAGYGVAVGNGAHALIERNVFDAHRHAIAADPTARTGYRAYRNLVLTRGYEGENQFDMHGDTQCWFLGGHDLCGTAGNDFDVRYNSFLYTGGAAIKVRGTPRLTPIGAVVSSNVFAHSDIGSAVQSSGNGLLVGAGNQVGVTAWSASEGCDFDGDGIPDHFIATGQTLWYRSGDASKGETPWVYLNSSTERTDGLALGYFSGGWVCDVVDGGLISVGGSGPWKPMLFLRAQ